MPEGATPMSAGEFGTSGLMRRARGRAESRCAAAEAATVASSSDIQSTGEGRKGQSSLSGFSDILDQVQYPVTSPVRRQGSGAMAHGPAASSLTIR